MKTEYAGDILSVRAVEDCIRATKNYTEDVFHRNNQHSVQGADFPSRVLIKRYEVYPDTTVCWDMPASEAIDWLWGETVHINVTFRYSYPTNKAWIIVGGSNGTVKELDKIPGFTRTVQKLEKNGHG